MGYCFLYGNGSGGATGATLTVTAPAGATVTATKDDKSKSNVAGSDGVAVFKGLESGDWTVTISDGTQTATNNITITADYAITMAFFAATINVTYPAGSTCTATDGTTTLTAPDTSGAWACVVPNTGTWTVTCTNGSSTATASVSITTDGESKSVTLMYSIELFSQASGGHVESVTGGWTATGLKVNYDLYEGAPSITFNNPTDFTFKSYSEGGRGGYVRTNNKIHIPKDMVLHVNNTFTYSDSQTLTMFVCKTPLTGVYTGNSGIIAQVDISDTSVPKEYSIPLSPGDYYVCFYITRGGSAASRDNYIVADHLWID